MADAALALQTAVARDGFATWSAWSLSRRTQVLFAFRELPHAARVQAGMVGINVPVPVPMAYYAFGGWKASLFGDVQVHGTEGVAFYTRGKVVTERWPQRAGGVDYGFPVHR